MIFLLANSGVMGMAGFGGFPPCLASLDLTFEQVGIATVMVLLSVPAISGIRGWFSKPRTHISPQPLVVEEAPKFVSAREIELRQQAMEQRVTAIETRQAEMDEKLGNDIGMLRQDIGKLHGRIDNSMQTLNDKIAAVPAQIVSLLNATRNLNR